MKLRYIRWIDRYIGVMACFVISLWRHFLRLMGAAIKNPCANKNITKILIIKFWGFGSITLAFDFFQVIRKAYPNAFICALTLKQNREVFEISGLFDEIVDIELRRLPRFLFDAGCTVFWLRKRSFDVSFDLEFTSRFSALTACLINAGRRIGFKYSGIWRGNCFTDMVEFKEDVRLRHSFLKLSSVITGDTALSPEPVKLNISAIQRDSVDSILTEEGLSDVHPVVGVNVNASELCLLRRWPKDYFVILTDELIKKYRAHIIFIGDKDNAQYVAEVIEGISKKSNIHNFTGRISLSQLACLFTKLDLFISNDSGPLHLAAYMKAPTISFFGPETPLIYGPAGPKDVIFYKGLGCSPCIRVKNYKHAVCADNNRCLKEITPPEVISEIERKRLL